ncbi:MAG: exodeoxyribonuclease V subunit alpha [Francisella sp.]
MYKTFYKACEKLADIRAVDFFFAKEVLNLINVTEGREVLFHLLMKLMHLYGDGHSCINIEDVANKTIFATDKSEDGLIKLGFKMPSANKIKDILDSLNYDNLPIYFAKEYNSLYIKRLWYYENEIADFIRFKIQQKTRKKDSIENIVSQLFDQGEEVSYQKEAIIKSLEYNFSIISGGPGTGKTTTVAKLLLALELINNEPQKIVLLAPTGKAAQRMTESLKNTLNNIITKEIPNFLQKNNNLQQDKKCLDDVLNHLNTLQAQTLHRFLGLRPNSSYVKYDKNSKAAYDVVVVDESSMLDINIFIKLIRSVRYDAKLILIGDSNQLPSVEAGSLLSNLTYDVNGKVMKYTTLLLKNYRSQQYINNLALSVLKGDISNDSNDNINFYSLNKLDAYLKKYAQKYLQLDKCKNYKEALVELSKFRILVANKKLEIGTDFLNYKIEKLMSRPIGQNYKGKPIMITQNSYALGLFNGDVGIIWPDSSGKLRAYFEGREDKSFSLNMLPKYESVYVMTIHKTQGSEFDEVVIILPEEDNRVLSRQLLYTAITRAKNKLTIISNKSLLRDIVQKVIQRNSNINNLLDNN